MKISKKLLIIVLLTMVEISVTIFAAFEMQKGAGFHQLNILHLKYNAEISDEIYAIENGKVLSTETLEPIIRNVRQQPVDCLGQVSALEKILMKQIGTFYALEICVEDLAAADVILQKLKDYNAGNLDHDTIMQELRTAEEVFSNSSAMFEKPIAETVDFIFKTMIPLIIFISMFNILFISYLSRSISKSISDVTDLLESDSGAQNFNNDIDTGVPGEIRDLLVAAKKAIKKESLQKDINQKLDGLVQEKTASLQLANEELTQFSYRASHDLKSPLIAISRLVDCILDDLEDGDTEEVVVNAKKIKERSISLSTLVADIMDLSRADLVEEDSEVIDINHLLDDLKKSLADTTGDHKVEISCHNKAESVLVSQPTRLKQVLYNLVSNGVKYANTDSENSFVEVTFSTVDDQCCVEIADNGVGIPEEFQGKLFERFQRFHPEMAEGSGLGLSIVKSNIDKLDASVEFSSSPKGTRYAISIPERKAA